MDHELRHSIEKIGCSPEPESAGPLLEDIGNILANQQDHRYPVALDILHRLPQQDSDALRMRLLELRGIYPRDPVVRAPPSPYRDMTHPDDDAWPREFDRLVAAPRDPAATAEFTKAVLNVFGNRLPKAADDSRRAFLTKHRQFFSGILRQLEEQMAPPDVVALKRWIAEAALFQLQDRVDLANKERAAARWKAVERCAMEMQQASQSVEQTRRIDEALAKARTYGRWKKRFDHLSSLIRDYDFNGQALFPWSPPETIDSRPATTIAQLEEVCAGLDRWGAPSDWDAWRDGLHGLGKRALEGLCTSIDKPAQESLKCMQDLRAQWPEALGLLPDAQAWDAAAAVLREQLETLMSGWLGQLREGFQDRWTLMAARNDHPELSQLASIAVEERRRFANDVDKLESIDTDLSAWWEEGDTSALRDRRLERLGKDLAALRGQWGKSPGHASYCLRLDRLEDELRLLDRAEQQIRDGDAVSALKTLEQCSSPTAERLRADAHRSSHDERIRIAVEQGKFDRITRAHLDRSSPDTRSFHDHHLLGHGFVEEMRRTAANSHEQEFNVFARTLLDLVAAEPPTDALFNRGDEGQLEQLRRAMRDRVIQRADRETEEIKARCTLYPLLNRATLEQLESKTADLAEVLDRFHPVDANRILETLHPIQTSLRVHRACLDGDWQTAEAELTRSGVDTYLDHGQLRALLATLRTSRLLGDRACDASWLALFRELSDVLMQHADPRERYLSLLRGATDGDHAVDQPILTRWFSQEAYLASLLSCFTDASAALDIDAPPSGIDEPVFVRLLRHLMLSPYNYYPVRQLWGLLSAETRARLWGTDPSPLDHVAELLRREHRCIETRLADPDTEIPKLKQDLDNLIKTGLVDARTIKMLDVAAGLERCIRDFERQDPWDRALRPALEATKRDLGYLTPAIRDARGWSRMIGQRIEGIVAWDDLDAAWKHFNSRFNRLFVGFHRDAHPWSGFQKLLRRWLESMEQANARLHWDLPGTRQSRRWGDLLEGWSDSPEGHLYRDMDRDNPADLTALLDIYRRLAEQIDAFVRLHAGLLEAPTPELLQQLSRMQPLSRPVQQIKDQLTNPDAALVIGSAYRRFVAEPAPS